MAYPTDGQEPWSADLKGYIDDGDVAGGAAELGLNAHLSDTADAHDASAISFVPTGTVSATNVQDAIAEVASEGGGVPDPYTGRIDQVRGDADVTPRWETEFTGTLDTNDQSIAAHIINGVIRSWLNEWGALRGRNPYTSYCDALARYIVEVGDFTGTTGQGGNAFEVVDRRLAAGIQRQRWGIRAEDGSLVRNGQVVKQTITWVQGDADPTAGGTIAIPAAVHYIIRLDDVTAVPSWVPAGSIIIRA